MVDFWSATFFIFGCEFLFFLAISLIVIFAQVIKYISIIKAIGGDSVFWRRKNKKTQTLREFYQNSKPDQGYNWLDYYRPNHKKGAMGWGDSFYKKPSKPGKRTLYRVVAVLSILAVLLLVRELNYPLGENVRTSLRYVLTTEWNIRPALEKAVKYGLQMANLDNQLDSGMPQEGMVSPVSGDALTNEMLLPVSGKVIRPVGWTKDQMDGLDRFHHGIDIQAAVGTPVKAVLAGKVASISSSPLYGKYIKIDHGDGYFTLYAGVDNIAVKEGESVKTGDVIAECSALGDFNQGGLHFELREKSGLVDPLTRLEFPR